ncbi:sigma-70 RNA polymerase sigma factor region 4 domain-containing protein [Bacillus chungangensis]|uniref:DNA-directed RNA polymerase specialized sigma24 family protein n=1 Tax=Bacillus chungangensis TaxID=587633 RepID=A0ABT9WMH2_9BACI|nr:hypothetical protein [Bacillus chungangensis]MDQ0174441.1 DNA-directed RNA polymerase specialized sigma24 family protein [Bacillus chungangensis]
MKNLISEYQKTRSDLVFSEIYFTYYSDNKRIVEKLSAKYKIDEADIESMINDKLMKVVENLDIAIGNFKKEMAVAVKNGCLDLIRKMSRENSYLADNYLVDEDGDDLEIFEVVSVAPTTDDEFIVNLQKNRDQRQLVAELLRKADEQTLTSISAFVQTNSYRQAAKQVGLSCHKAMKKRIRRIARQYDANRFGSYHDYFTVPTRFVG